MTMRFVGQCDRLGQMVAPTCNVGPPNWLWKHAANGVVGYQVRRAQTVPPIHMRIPVGMDVRLSGMHFNNEVCLGPLARFQTQKIWPTVVPLKFMSPAADIVNHACT